MSRPAGGRPDTTADRRMAAGLALALGFLFLVLATYKPERAEAADPRADTARVMAQLEADGRQIDGLTARLEEDRRLLEVRQHAMDRARAHGTPDWVVQAAWDQAHEASLDPQLVLQLIEVESDWDADLVHVNRDGSVDAGLGQTNSGTLAFAAQLAGIARPDPFDPEHSIKMTVAYLAYLERTVGPAPDRVLTAYNRGEAGLQMYIASRGTARSPYSEAVLRRGD